MNLKVKKDFVGYVSIFEVLFIRLSKLCWSVHVSDR